MRRDCIHKWVFQHVVYWEGSPRPGSGAYERMYGDKYYCEKCLEESLKNPRALGTSYEHPIPGTFPR